MSDDAVMFAGLEGGASNTVLVILGADGTEKGRSTGPGSNAWLKSIEDVADMIINMKNEALTAGGLPADTKLVSMGLCMSGFSAEVRQNKLKELLGARGGGAGLYEVHNDSVGAAYTVTPTGGFVIISGTGAIAHVATDTVDKRVGGYGHLFSDEGSAYSIATAALRIMVRTLDNVATPMACSRADAEACRDVVYKHLASEDSPVTCTNDLVRIFFHEFNKAKVASLTRMFADLARGGNKFLQNIFTRAGEHLGRMIRAAAPDAPRAEDGSFSVLAVGSVWKSLDLLRDGLISTACATEPPLPVTPEGGEKPLPTFYILRPRDTAAVGAAAVAATHAGKRIPLDFSTLNTPVMRINPSDSSWEDLTSATDGAETKADAGAGAGAGAGTGSAGAEDGTAAEAERAAKGFVLHKGGCHCGAVRFEIDHTPEVIAWDCNCSICLMKRNVHFMVPKSRLRLLKGASDMTTYRFNTKVAKHMFCKHCGVQAFYQPRSNPDGWGVTVNCIDDGTITKLTVKKYDGQNWEASHAATGIAALSKE